MTFEKLLDQACMKAHLPNTASDQLPSALKEKTKKRAMGLSSEKLGEILATAIEKVNNGSIESIDSLVKKQIKDS